MEGPTGNAVPDFAARDMGGIGIARKASFHGRSDDCFWMLLDRGGNSI